MKKYTLLAALLAANISAPAFAGMAAEPSSMEVFFEEWLSQPDPGILCRSDRWACLGSVKTINLACRTEIVTPENKGEILEKMGIKEARQRYSEKSPKPGLFFFFTKKTDEPRMFFKSDGKEAQACVFSGAPEFADAILTGAKK